MEKNNPQPKEKILKQEKPLKDTKKEGEMVKKKPKDKTVIGVIGVLLTLFGVIGSIPVLQNRQYIWLIITAIAVIFGVILVAYSLD